MAEAQATACVRHLSCPFCFVDAGVQTPCGGLPEAYQEMLANSTIVMKASYEMALFLGGQVGTHEPIVMVW